MGRSQLGHERLQTADQTAWRAVVENIRTVGRSSMRRMHHLEESVLVRCWSGHFGLLSLFLGLQSVKKTLSQRCCVLLLLTIHHWDWTWRNHVCIHHSSTRNVSVSHYLRSQQRILRLLLESWSVLLQESKDRTLNIKLLIEVLKWRLLLLLLWETGLHPSAKVVLAFH